MHSAGTGEYSVNSPLPGQYRNLGQYQLTTAADLTGLNVGNLTSYIDTSSIKMAKFELYRLVINVSNVPNISNVPKVVQVTRNQGTGTTLTLTFGKPTTVGNAIIVVSNNTGNAVGFLSSVTIAGVADNFGVVAASKVTDSSNQNNLETWIDPESSVSNASIVLTYSSSIGNAAYAYEVSGIIQTAVVANTVDTAQTGSATATSVSTASGTTSGTDDLIVGAAEAAASTLTMSLGAGASPSGWTQEPEQQVSGSFTMVSGYVVAPASGTAAKYSSSYVSSEVAIANFVAFISGTQTSLPAQIPFQIYLDSQLWDNNQTVAGVGFSYDPNTAMLINQGQQLRVLWTNLPTTVFSAYASSISVTAFFRYDPTIPANAAILGNTAAPYGWSP